MDGDNEQQRPGLRERIGRRAWVRSAALVSGGLIAGGIIAGTVTANAADEGTPDSSTSHGADRGGHGRGHHGGNVDHSQPQRDDEELLTGDTATRVTEAVLAEYPDAEIERVETDSNGVYEAHIVTADDERLTVLVDEGFEVTGTEEHRD
ncbi:MAG: hypothetical protein ACLGI3_06945 [Actinomycetes bacterium]